MQDAVDDAKKLQVVCKTTKQEADKAQQAVDAAAAHIKRIEVEVETAERSAAEKVSMLEEKLCRAEALASERAMQLSILTDTVEALQSTHNSDRDQRIVNLTAQLVSSRGCEASLRSRSNDLLTASEGFLKQCAALEHAKDTLDARCRRAEERAQSFCIQHQEECEKVDRLKQQMQKMDLEVTSLKTEIHGVQQRLNASELECKSLHMELKQASSRSFEQQKLLRQANKVAVQSNGQQLMQGLPSPVYLQDFCTALEGFHKAGDSFEKGTY